MNELETKSNKKRKGQRILVIGLDEYGKLQIKFYHSLEETQELYLKKKLELAHKNFLRSE